MFFVVYLFSRFVSCHCLHEYDSFVPLCGFVTTRYNLGTLKTFFFEKYSLRSKSNQEIRELRIFMKLAAKNVSTLSARDEESLH